MEFSLASLKDVELLIRRATSPKRDTADSSGGLWAARDGALITMPWLTAMALEGRVFNSAQASPDTKLTGSVDYDATHPGLCFVAPAGIVMIPIHLDVHAEDMTGTDNHVMVVVDNGNLYASGGTASAAVTNLRTDTPIPSAVTKYYNSDSAITITDPGAGETILWQYFDAFADATTSPPFIAEWNPRVPPVLVGPATFMVYIYSGTTALEYGFSLQWVELAKNAVV